MYGLYFLPGSNFAPFEEVKVQVCKSADFFLKSAPWRILMDLGWLGLNIHVPKAVVRWRGLSTYQLKWQRTGQTPFKVVQRANQK